MTGRKTRSIKRCSGYQKRAKEWEKEINKQLSRCGGDVVAGGAEIGRLIRGSRPHQRKILVNSLRLRVRRARCSCAALPKAVERRCGGEKGGRVVEEVLVFAYDGERLPGIGGAAKPATQRATVP